MNKTLALCCLLLLPGCVAAKSPADGGPALLLDSWSVAGSWNTGVEALDFAQTLDRKLVFALGRDSRVRIYSADGGPLGTVPAGNQAVALAIEPRGRMLYVADQSGACTAVSISFDRGVLTWSVRKTWKTDGTPVDIALSGSRVFVLGADSSVHVYSPEGARLGVIPVAPGTVAIDLAPQGGLLHLANQDGTCTALFVSF